MKSSRILPAFGEISQEPETIDVWRVALDDPGFIVGRLKRWLADEEIVQAQRFSTSELQRRFIVRRAARRWLLSQYCGTDPQQIAFIIGEHGKPMIAGGPSNPSVCFNASNSGGVELLAVGAKGVGIDIEQIVHLPDLDAVIKQMVSDADKHLLKTTDPEAKLRAFYRQWNCKEAALKATGRGLSVAPSDITVGAASIGFGSNGAVQVGHDPWHISCFEPLPGFSAALATRSAAVCLNIRECTPGTLTAEPPSCFGD